MKINNNNKIVIYNKQLHTLNNKIIIYNNYKVIKYN